MGLQYADLDEETRKYMIEEIDRDIDSGEIYLSTNLNQTGQGNWPDHLKEAALSGNDDTLAAKLQRTKSLNDTAIRRNKNGGSSIVKVPHDAAEMLAQGEFNRYYVRGLARKAIANGIPRLEVYRAKQVDNPRIESERIISLLFNPEVVLSDVRGSNGVETAFGVPGGPRSGISLRVPR